MEIILAVYLIIAGSLVSGYKDGLVKDTSSRDNFVFEKHVAELNGDKMLADKLENEIESLNVLYEKSNGEDACLEVK